MAVTVPATETDSFELNISLEDGNSVNIAVTYPKGNARVALLALAKTGEDSTLQQLMYTHRDDASIVDYMERKGISFVDDEYEG